MKINLAKLYHAVNRENATKNRSKTKLNSKDVSSLPDSLDSVRMHDFKVVWLSDDLEGYKCKNCGYECIDVDYSSNCRG